ncbi:GNAT family N-acetyltransferase [Mumia sp. DW29H23]|uniref:GNAT family N-acetyltransferase n=1 Tax=Mumia sp. DW29H23 TaxID=3421241 RepID=UPI003D68B8E5
MLCVVRDAVVHVTAPPHLVDRVRRWAPSVSAVQDAGWWSEHLPGWSVVGPAVHSFADRVEPVASARIDVTVRPAQPGELRRLRDAVSEPEWVESGFAGDVEQAWVALDPGGRPLAAANLTRFAGMDADVGVLADPAARGRGVAVVVAATAARDAVRQHGLVRWRALASNVASRRLAHRLGFEDDAVEVVVRPPR